MVNNTLANIYDFVGFTDQDGGVCQCGKNGSRSRNQFSTLETLLVVCTAFRDKSPAFEKIGLEHLIDADIRSNYDKPI